MPSHPEFFLFSCRDGHHDVHAASGLSGSVFRGGDFLCCLAGRMEKSFADEFAVYITGTFDHVFAQSDV